MNMILRKKSGDLLSISKLRELLLNKMSAGIDDKTNMFCSNEVNNLAIQLSTNTLIGPLLSLNSEIIKIFIMFYQAGYLMGNTIAKNSLEIVVKEEDTNTNADTAKSNESSVTSGTSNNVGGSSSAHS